MDERGDSDFKESEMNCSFISKAGIVVMATR